MSRDWAVDLERLIVSLSLLAFKAEQLASVSYSELSRDNRVRLRTPEEATTHSLLRRLIGVMNEVGALVRVHSFTKPQEARFGADLEIWLRLPGGGNLGYSFQSKVIKWDGDSGSYDSIRHVVSSTKELQHDLLLEHARNVSANAYHLLYNGAPVSGSPAFRRLLGPWHAGEPLSHFGYAAAATNDICQLIESGETDAAKYLPRSVPWAELFTPRFIDAFAPWNGEPRTTRWRIGGASNGYGRPLIARELPGYAVDGDLIEVNAEAARRLPATVITVDFDQVELDDD